MTIERCAICLTGLDAREADYVSVAERFLHTPYLWGGKSSLGIRLARGILAESEEAPDPVAELGERLEVRIRQRGRGSIRS